MDGKTNNQQDEDPNGSFRIILFNVGAGDHILLRLPGKQYAIIDFHFQDNLAQIEPPAITYLREILDRDGELKLAFVCLSHFDLDHIRGTDQFFEWFRNANGVNERVKLDNFWFGGASNREFLQKKLRKIIQAAMDEENPADKTAYEKRFGYKARYQIIDDFIKEWRINNPNNTEEYIHEIRNFFKFDSGIRAYSIGPLQQHIDQYRDQQIRDIEKGVESPEAGSTPADQNLVSPIFFLEHENFRCCFGSDADTQMWVDSLNKLQRTGLKDDYPIYSDFVKISHHGSRHASDPVIWNELYNTDNRDQKICIGISAGKAHHHPTPDALRDIYGVCGDTNAEVLTTNACTHCVHQQLQLKRFEEIKLSGEGQLQSIVDYADTEDFDYIKDDLAEDDQSQAEHQSDNQNLKAYVIDFKLDDGTPKIRQAMTDKITERFECRFSNYHTKPRPHCHDRHNGN